jgi:hypothetical protein
MDSYADFHEKLEFMKNEKFMGELHFVLLSSELPTCVRVFGNEFLSFKIYDGSS